MPAQGSAAAWSKDTPSGIRAAFASRTVAYSANPLWLPPMMRSPTSAS